MTENIIQIKDDKVRRLKIVDQNGKATGDYLEFQMDDIELPLRYQEIQEKIKKNFQWLRNQKLIIDKRQDVKGKKLMSKNEEDKIRALNEYYRKQEEAYNMFLGENGVKKLLAGRNMSWETFDEIDEIIEQQILPYINQDTEDIVNRIVSKYGIDNDKNVIK